MFCDACGARIDAGQRFCPSCGKPLNPIASPLAAGAGVPAGAVYVQPPRVASHIKPLGILWVVYSALHLIPGLIIIGLFGSIATFLPPDVPAFVMPLMTGIGVMISAISALGLVTAWGLLAWKPWARMLSLILGILSLLNFPFGTALGIYTLWVLMPAASEREYQQRVGVVAPV